MLTDLDEIRRRADQHRADFDLLRYLLQRNDRLDDAKFDTFVDQVAAPIIAAIDCTQCANCCRRLDVYLVEDDARRLSNGLLIPIDQIETRYIEHEEAARVEEWGKFKQRPCAFLDGKLCSVYEHRPESCRIYPAFAPDFRWTIEDIIDEASLCPIIYHVLVALCDRLLRHRRE